MIPKKIRPGQKREYNKSTQAAIDTRVNEVEAMLRAGPVLKSKLVAQIKTKFNVEWRMAEIYITRARERLLLHLKEARDEHRAVSLAFYEGMMVHPKTSQREKMIARERIDKLLGLEDHVQKLEHSGVINENAGVAIDDLGLDLDTRRRILEAVREKKTKLLATPAE